MKFSHFNLPKNYEPPEGYEVIPWSDTELIEENDGWVLEDFSVHFFINYKSTEHFIGKPLSESAFPIIRPKVIDMRYSVDE